uniref:Uncharacterized protein n=1 Tax=Anopheles merus TaxID=30066 RepID=A0A182VIA9_ANOME
MTRKRAGPLSQNQVKASPESSFRCTVDHPGWQKSLCNDLRQIQVIAECQRRKEISPQSPGAATLPWNRPAHLMLPGASPSVRKLPVGGSSSALSSSFHSFIAGPGWSRLWSNPASWLITKTRAPRDCHGDEEFD